MGPRQTTQSTVHGCIYVTVHLLNSINFVTSAAMADVYALLSAIYQTPNSEFPLQ